MFGHNQELMDRDILSIRSLVPWETPSGLGWIRKGFSA